MEVTQDEPLLTEQKAPLKLTPGWKGCGCANRPNSLKSQY